MAVTNSQYLQFMRDAVAGGFVYAFNYGPIGTISFDTTVTGSGATSGQTTLIQPKGRYIAAPTVIDGLVRRADGAIFNPWGLAGQRAPTAFAAYTQTFMYIGHTALTMQQYEKLMGLVGLTGLIYLSYGRTTGDTFSVKACNAMLMTVSAAAERVLEVGSGIKTFIEFSATWQQTSAFIW